MAGIQEYLDLIKNAIYGKDVRQAIHDGIHQCYEDGRAGSIDLIAREEIAQLVAPSGEAPSAAEVTDARVGDDGATYASLGLANRTQFSDIKNDVNLVENGERSFQYLASWFNGGLTFNSDHTALVADTSKQYRVASLDTFKFDYDVIISIATGFRVVYLTKQGGVFTDNGWKTGEIIVSKNTEFALIIGRTTENTSEVANIGEFTSSLTITTANTKGIDDINEKLAFVIEASKNLVVPYQELNLYVGSTDKLTLTNMLCAVYIKCEPNTTYTISKVIGTRFAVGYTTEFPTVNTPLKGRISNYTGARITITTGADAEYLYAWIYNSTDSSTYEETLASVQIEKSGSPSDYVEPFSAIDRNLRAKAYVNQGDVVNNSDANTIIDDGGYVIGYNLVVDNLPESTGRRFLFVTSGGVNPAYKKQFFFNETTGSIYSRDFAGGAWETWAEMGNKSTQDTCGAFDGRLALSHGGIPRRHVYENSPKAFKEARRLGIFYNDIDVTFTSDYVPIIVHDAEVVPYGGTDPVVFRTTTYSQLQQYNFGDADYTWKLQTLKEAYELNAEIGCKIGVDIGYLTSGAMPRLLTYMRNNGIKPIYLVSSELTTFNQFIASEAFDFPLGIVLSSTDSDEYITQKLNALLDMQTEHNLPKAWAFFRHEMIDNEQAPYYSWAQTLVNAGVTIEMYSFNTLSEIANAQIPSFVSAWGGDSYNVNYERYKLIMAQD